MSVWYLDLDDEITDAVARLRAAKDGTVVLVLPPGSRIGTGRINFRLLAREAENRGLSLAMVSSDAQVRALATSAGLTAHVTVADAERSLGIDVEEDAPAGARSTTTASLPPAARVSTAVSTADAAEAAAAGTGGSRFGSLLHRRRESYTVTPRTATTGATVGAVTVATHGAGEGARIVRRGPSTRRKVATWGMRGAMVGALAAAGLYVAYLTLPTATVTLIPGSTTLDPAPVAMVASPNTPVVDAAGRAIPADWYQIPLSKSGTFAATGRNEELTYARGKVVFTSNNTIVPVVVRVGSRVSTVDGRDYITLQQVELPRYSGDPPRPSVEVEVRAARRGRDGNTGPGTITRVSKELDRQQIRVTNPDRIEGGDRIIRDVVTPKDCDTARAQLLDQLQVQLLIDAGRPGTAGLTRFPSSATFRDPVFTPDCAALIDTPMETDFELTVEAVGTVLEVDESLLVPAAQEHFALTQDPTTQIEPGSIVATQDGEPDVTADAITFPMAVTARVTKAWDASRIRQEIAGQPVSEARDILNDYGEATIVMWPDFVPNVPTDVNRISLVIPQQ